MKTLTIVAALSVAFLLGIAPLRGVSTSPTKTTHLTFSHSVQVPGATLPAGTYTFSLLAARGNRRIVRVTSRNGDKLFATILALPDYRTEATTHTVILFGESGACAKETPIKAWFYPNEKTGFRFVYPKDEAAEIAADCNESVPEVSDEALENANPSPDQVRKLEDSPVQLITPDKREGKYSVADLSASDKADRNGMDAENGK